MMKNILYKFAAILILLILQVNLASALEPATAKYVYNTKNYHSCSSVTDLQRVRGISTIGSFFVPYLIHEYFVMVDDKALGTETTESCKIPLKKDEKIKYCVQNNCGSLGIGDKATHQLNGLNFLSKMIMDSSVTLRGIDEGDKVCIQVQGLLNQWVNLGCKIRQREMPSNSQKSSNVSCYLYNNSNCIDDTIKNSMSVLPLSAPIVKCFEKAVKEFFLGSAGCDTALSIFQNNMRQFVSILLTLYVIFFGIKVILGREIPNKNEIFIFFIKIATVVYFSVGFKSAGGISHGVNDVFHFFMSLMQGLAQIVIDAGITNSDLCNIENNLDPSLKIWDVIDCRLAYYSGLNDGRIVNFLVMLMLLVVFLLLLALITPIAIKGMIAASPVGMVIIGIVLGTIGIAFTGTVLIPVMIYTVLTGTYFLVTMIIISVTVHIVHVYLIALLIITIAVFVAPIFVPMCLFETTKRMFESWVKAIFGYVIQPVVLFIFLGFMYTMMDMVMFGKCKIVVNDNWRSSTQNTILTSLGVDKSKIKVWSITDKGAEDVEGCVNSYGFLIQNIFDFGFAGSSFGFGDINIHNVLENCIIVFVFAVIFYFFARLADSIAADISQSIGMSDMAMQATHLADKAFETMVKGAMLATSAAGKVFQLAGSPVNPADVVKRGVNKAMQKGREAKNKLENTKQNVSKVVNTVKDKLNKKPNE